MGKSIVATDVDGTSEMVFDGRNGFLVPLRTPEILAQKILVLVKDKALRLKMGEESRRIVREKFDIHNTVNKTDTLYRKLLYEKGVYI